MSPNWTESRIPSLIDWTNFFKTLFNCPCAIRCTFNSTWSNASYLHPPTTQNPSTQTPVLEFPWPSLRPPSHDLVMLDTICWYLMKLQKSMLLSHTTATSWYGWWVDAWHSDIGDGRWHLSHVIWLSALPLHQPCAVHLPKRLHFATNGKTQDWLL